MESKALFKQMQVSAEFSGLSQHASQIRNTPISPYRGPRVPGWDWLIPYSALGSGAWPLLRTACEPN